MGCFGGGGVYINCIFFLKYKYFLQINIKFLNLLYVSCVTQITRVPNDGMNNGYYGHSMASVSSNENSQREECWYWFSMHGSPLL